MEMEEEPVNLISDEEEETSSSDAESEDSSDVNLPSCSHRNPTPQQEEESSSSSSESDSEESSESSDEGPEPPTTRASVAKHSECQANKRAIEARNFDIQAKKRRLEEEKAYRKQKLREIEIYRPGQCMKYMYVEMHPTLASAWYMSDVARELEAAGARIQPTPTLVHPGLIVWTRVLPMKLRTVDGQVQLSSSKQHCGMSLYVCTSDEVAERVADSTLMPHIDSLREMVDGDLSVIVFVNFNIGSRSSGRRTVNSSRKTLTELQMEQIKIDLLISTGVDVQFMDNTSELAMWIMQCTRAVAEAPFKKAKRELDYAASGFYMRGDNRKCVAVDKEGHGLGRLWQQMVSVLPTASLEVARALCGKYTSPAALMEGMERPTGVGELADLGVARTGVPDSRARRLGPEFARKLHLLYSSRNGSIVVE
ncbi:crossover junction endonuclease EME1 isoform X1 [Manduca sexta]|uniref:crossover junction endonuclease EME1 isoform X1 n=1 Tax=Manduca sexta TaxID=7130 RepID=UPI0011836C44|nr:crossover junction endonuclease EME1 isoform X1 [Manduca sexta]